MTDATTRRTVRRSTALLLVPLGLLVLQAGRYLRLQGVDGGAMTTATRPAAFALLVGAVGYLLWSAFDQIVPPE